MDRGASVADTLDRARERGFVARATELAGVESSLDQTSQVRVHLVHGPGGIGKTTLLDACGRAAARRGMTFVYLDARDIEPTAAAVVDAVRSRAGDDVEEPDLLLVDGYELLADLDGWFRTELLPARPARSVTILAGRAAPNPAWRRDTGWRELTAVHELRALDDDDSRALLARLGVRPAAHDDLTRLGRGYPLALALLAEAHADASRIAELTDAPTVVATLCAQLVDDVPDEAHRTGLATCAHATRMTQDLLARTVGVRTPEVWAWLESRPYVRRGELGLFLHDVVREVFDAELAQRSPDAYVELHTTVRGYFLERLFDPAEPHPDRAAAQILLLHRRNPLQDQTAALRDAGLLSVEHARPEDLPGVMDLLAQTYGPNAAEVARRYVELYPRGVYRVRGDGDTQAVALQIYLPTGGPLDAKDPVAVAVLDAVAEHGPLRPGERINVHRFGAASGRNLDEPLALLVNGVSNILEWGREPAAWTFLTIPEHRGTGRYLEYLGMARMFSVEVGALTCVGYGWDRRRFPVSLLFEMMARRELTGETGPPPADLVRPAPLSRDQFAAAVRGALGDLAFPDRLSASPLVASGLADPSDPQPAKALEATLRTAIAGLEREPGGAEHRRVLERTYLHGAPSQEAAAELLGLPFSTYRRHLARAQERLTEVLWALEVGGK